MTLSRKLGSRYAGRALAILSMWSLVIAPGLHAQDAPVLAPQVTADEALRAAAEVYGPPDPRKREECPPPKPGDEIVVCGQTEDASKYRVQSSSDLDPSGLGSRGSPKAPDLYNLPQPAMIGAGVSAKGCFIPPCPPPMPVLIDLKAIPEAPEGSDADLIARGEKPG